MVNMLTIFEQNVSTFAVFVVRQSYLLSNGLLGEAERQDRDRDQERYGRDTHTENGLHRRNTTRNDRCINVIPSQPTKVEFFKTFSIEINLLREKCKFTAANIENYRIRLHTRPTAACRRSI